jgi:hypothetical protein
MILPLIWIPLLMACQTRNFDPEALQSASPVGLPSQIKERVLSIKATVQKLMSQPENAPLSDAGSCSDFTLKWLGLLKKEKGFAQSYYSQTDGFGHLRLNGNSKVQKNKNHVFVTERGLCGNEPSCENEIIIDSTYSQYLEPGECLYGAIDPVCKNLQELQSLPKVFVGTQKELIAFFQKLKHRIRFETKSGLDPDVGKYEVTDFVSLVYSFGENAKIRSNLKM